MATEAAPCKILFAWSMCSNGSVRMSASLVNLVKWPSEPIPMVS